MTYIYGLTGWSNDPATRLPADAEGDAQVLANTNDAHVFSPKVPEGQIWLLRTVSMSTGYAGETEYMIEHLVNVPGGHHYHEIARGKAAGTPVLHVPSSDLRVAPFLPGERIGFRTLGTGPIFGMWSGWSFPLSDLERVMGLAQGPAPSIDYTPFLASLEAAAQALQSITPPA